MINNSNNILYQDSIPFFTTIMDLRAFQDYDQGSIVEVGGRVSIGDGYGSKFIYDSTSTEADDNEYVVRPDNIAANGSGRWLINGWAFLDDKMNANNKYLTGMTITSSEITNSTIDNTTIKGSVSVDPTTDWSKNTVVGALDIDNRYETKDHANTSLSDLSQNLTTTLENYTDTSVNNMGALKANLAGGNTLTGNQVINGNLNVVSSSGQIQGSSSGSTTKWYLQRKDSQNCALLNSYDGNNWHHLAINDDDTVSCNGGTLALQSAVDTKANLSGGNALVGDQSISSGSLKVLGSDNSYTGILKDAEATEKGAIVRYNDGTTNHDWVLGTDSITAPNGETISTSGNYAVKNEDNHFQTDQTFQGNVSITSGGSIILTNPSGDTAQIYTDARNSNGLPTNDIWFRTGDSPSPVYTGINNKGELISSTFGNAAFENRENTFVGNQTVNEGGIVLATGGYSFQALGGDGSLFELFKRPNSTDTAGKLSLFDGSNWHETGFWPTGDITTTKGNVAFVHNDFDYGPIDSGYYTRVGNIITQAFNIRIGGLPYVNFKIAFASGVTPVVFVTPGPNDGGANGQVFMMRTNVSNTGFQLSGLEWNGSGWQDSASGRTISVMAIGQI